jgi:hypothetical protein
MVFNFLSQIYYINGCPPTFYGLPFPSLIVEFPIYLFYLVSFDTEQASITMDINTRIVSIQHRLPSQHGSVEICNKSLGVIGVVGTECAAIAELVECKPLAVDGNENDGSE